MSRERLRLIGFAAAKAHRQECVRSHDILYRVLSGHPLHFGPVRAQKKEPSEEGEDGLGNCAR